MNEYKEMWSRWSDFRGKSDLRDFWMAWLVNFLIGVGFYLLRGVNYIPTISSIYSILIFVPMLALTIRRLHDTGRSGWHVLWYLLPVVGWIVLLIFLIQPSK